MASTGEAWRGLVTPIRIAIIATLALALATATTMAIRNQPAVDDPYLWFADINVEQLPIVAMTDGIPLVRYHGIAAPRENPVTVAQWGLSHYSQGDTATALRAADWLVSHQRSDGAWVYSFDFDLTFASETMRGPWISAMAQGQAVALLVRAWRLTRNATYLDTARSALRPFGRSVDDGGVRRLWRGHPFFEEYPTLQRPSLVLNGFLFAILGVRELAIETGDPTARQIWREGEETAAAVIRLYSQGDSGASSYSLTHLTGGPSSPYLVSGLYPQLHVDLANRMAEVTGRPVYSQVAERWSEYVPKSRLWHAGQLGLLGLVTLGLVVLTLLGRRLIRLHRPDPQGGVATTRVPALGARTADSP